MKSLPVVLTSLAICLVVAGCMTPPSSESPRVRVSGDYLAAGDSKGIRAYVYGKSTVLEFDTPPLWISICDKNGVTVPIEREGRFIRINRRLDAFDVWMNTRVVSFEYSKAGNLMPAGAVAAAVAGVMPSQVQQPTQVPHPDERPSAPASSMPGEPPQTGKGEDAEANALLELSAKQLAEVRKLLSESKDNPTEVKALNARLDRVEAQILSAAAAIVRVNFDTERTEFTPPKEVADVLVPAAKAAERINVRGRTDSRTAGVDDAKIALGRAISARNYLVSNGVDGAKIKIFSLPAGDFLAPSATAQGKSLNRRVDIELINRRYSELATQLKALERAPS